MNSIKGKGTDRDTLLEALRGDYGVEVMPNGITVLHAGRLVHFSGLFNGTQEVIEIPKLPARIVVLFAWNECACIALAEPNAGFVKVPGAARGKSFAVCADCVLNT